MRFFLFIFMLSTYLLGSQISASEFLPDPDETQKIKDKIASIDSSDNKKISFLKFIAEIEREIPQLSYPSKVYSYLEQIGQINECGNRSGILSYGPNPVKKMGAIVADEATKWLRLDKANDMMRLNFYTYAKPETMYRAIQLHQFYLSKEVEYAFIRSFLDCFNEILDYIKENQSTYSPSILSEARNAQTQAIKKMHIFSEKLEKDFEIIFAKVDTMTSIQDIVSKLRDDIYLKQDAAALVRYQKWLEFLIKKVVADVQRYPAYVLSTLSDAYYRLMVALLSTTGLVPDNTEIKITLSSFQASQLAEFLGVVDDIDPLKLELHQLEFLDFFVTSILERSEEEKSMTEGQVKRLRTYHDHLKLVMKELEIGDIEGHYVFSGSVSGSISVFDTGGKNYAATLKVISAGHGVEYPFQHIIYNEEGDVFQAERSFLYNNRGGVPNTRPMIFNFNIEKNPSGEKQIKAEFLLAGKKMYVEGYSDQSFALQCAETDYAILTSFQSGAYKNTIKGEAWSIDLQAAKNNYSAVAYVGSYPKIMLPFNYGYYDKNQKIIYLTSGEVESSRLLHLRGKFMDDGRFCSSYIAGSVGVIFKNQFFERSM